MLRAFFPISLQFTCKHCKQYNRWDENSKFAFELTGNADVNWHILLLVTKKEHMLCAHLILKLGHFQTKNSSLIPFIHWYCQVNWCHCRKTCSISCSCCLIAHQCQWLLSHGRKCLAYSDDTWHSYPSIQCYCKRNREKQLHTKCVQSATLKVRWKAFHEISCSIHSTAFLLRGLISGWKNNICFSRIYTKKTDTTSQLVPF